MDTVDHAMVSLRSKNHGIAKVVLHIMGKGGARHDARVKVSNVFGKWSDDNFSVNVRSLDVIGECKLGREYLVQIFAWIIINRSKLVKIWNQGDATPLDTITQLQPITKERLTELHLQLMIAKSKAK